MPNYLIIAHNSSLVFLQYNYNDVQTTKNSKACNHYDVTANYLYTLSTVEFSC